MSERLTGGLFWGGGEGAKKGFNMAGVAVALKHKRIGFSLCHLRALRVLCVLRVEVNFSFSPCVPLVP